MDILSDSPLGERSPYPEHYSHEWLFPVARSKNRASIQLGSTLPFFGCDLWRAYEVSWLNPKGKPLVFIADITVPCDSPFLIESKSLKLYLNSFNQSKFNDEDTVQALIQTDLSRSAGAAVSVSLNTVTSDYQMAALTGTCLDDQDILIDTYEPTPQYLSAGINTASETLYSHLLKSNCPVTGQPDWGSVIIRYTGKQIAHDGLLKYIVSLRGHLEFHEHCVERLFVDINKHCQPDSLFVQACYTRRGGLDINPMRSSQPNDTPLLTRLIRQ